MSSDRAAVAREATLQLVNEFTDGTADPLLTIEQRETMIAYINREYPPSPAPETVTVLGVAWTKQADPDGILWVASIGGAPNVADAYDFLARIASDARVIAELRDELTELRPLAKGANDTIHDLMRTQDLLKARTARIAELEKECVRLHGYIDVAQSEREKAWEERDAALRALEEKVAAGCSEGGTVQRNPTGEARYHADAERPDQPAVSSPAPASASGPRSAATPIPLGAVVNDGRTAWKYEDGEAGAAWVAVVPNGAMVDVACSGERLFQALTALYHARHPVATRETVERVALDAWRDVGKVELRHVRQIVDHTYKAAGFTLEGA